MPLLEISRLTKNFGGLTAINRLDFHINPGELVSVIGPNGSGKTTLFNLITGVCRPTAGVVKFCGDDITKLKPHQVVRLGIGRTFQRTTIFKRSTVLDNMVIGQLLHAKSGIFGGILGSKSSRGEELRTKLKAREILHFAGLLDMESQLAESMSQEAQKRLSIAMALAANPKLVLLDEPTAGVNIEEIDGLTDLVTKIHDAGTTVCVIEHKMRMVMNISHRILVLNHGEKIAEGEPKDIANNEEVIHAYLGVRNVA